MKPMDALRVILAIAWKNLQVILSDRGFVVIMFALPLICAVLNGIVNRGLTPSDQKTVSFPVALVNQDAGPYGRQVADILNTIEVFKVTSLDSPEAARQQVQDGKVMAAILIPSGLTEQVQSYKPSTVEVVADPVQKQFSGIIAGIVNQVVAPVAMQGEISYGIHSVMSGFPDYQAAAAAVKQAAEAQNLGVVMAQVQKMTSDPWIRVNTRTQTGADVVVPPSNIFALFVPSFTVLFAFFIIGAISSDLLEEKRLGSLRRLIAAPLPRWAIIAGKMLAYLVIVLLQVVLMFGVANVVFAMPLGSSLPALLLVSLAMGLAATGMGMLLAALAKSDSQANSIGMILGFGLGGLGGCFLISSPVPLFKSGGVMEVLSRLTPQAHAMLGFDQVINANAGVVAVLPEVLILLGYAVVSLALAAWRLRLD